MLMRKNLIVDPAKVRQLAVRLRSSESAAVRQAVDALLLESEVMAAIESLRTRGTLRDVYRRASRR